MQRQQQKQLKGEEVEAYRIRPRVCVCVCVFWKAAAREKKRVTGVLGSTCPASLEKDAILNFFSCDTLPRLF